MRRLTTVFAILVSAACMSVALPANPAEAREVDIWLEEDFNSSAWNKGWSAATIGPRNRIEMAGGHRGPGIKVSIPPGNHFGSEAYWRLADKGYEPEEVWFRYMIRFQTPVPTKGKLPGLSGAYSRSGKGLVPPSDELPGFSARMMFGPGEREDSVAVGFYLYHLDQRTVAGDGEWWNRDFEVGTWHCVEGRVTLNDPAKNNGELWGAVDGIPAYHRDNIRYRGEGHDYVKIRDFWLNTYLGGKNTAKDAVVVEYDSVAVAGERIGCNDATAVGSGAFDDDNSSVHEANIETIAYHGITKGCNPPENTRFCPKDRVTRGQMAAFLTRTGIKATGSRGFDDTKNHLFADAVSTLATAGITKGCNPPENTKFCPDAVVTRGQMAAFLSRALELGEEKESPFEDAEGHMFEGAVAALAKVGITKGCNPPENTKFCPDQAVTREQMATFLTRAYELVATPTPVESVAVRKGRINTDPLGPQWRDISTGWNDTVLLLSDRGLIYASSDNGNTFSEYQLGGWPAASPSTGAQALVQRRGHEGQYVAAYHEVCSGDVIVAVVSFNSTGGLDQHDRVLRLRATGSDHNSVALNFADDGRLLVAVGDYEIAKNAASDQHLVGKILAIDLSRLEPLAPVTCYSHGFDEREDEVGAPYRVVGYGVVNPKGVGVSNGSLWVVDQRNSKAVLSAEQYGPKVEMRADTSWKLTDGCPLGSAAQMGDGSGSWTGYVVVADICGVDVVAFLPKADGKITVDSHEWRQPFALAPAMETLGPLPGGGLGGAGTDGHFWEIRG